MLLGVCLAAFNAYSLARGFGRSLAQKVIATELGHGDGSAANPVQQKLAEVQAAIEGGGFWRQLAAIVVLRLTPVVPFRCARLQHGLHYTLHTHAALSCLTVCRLGEVASSSKQPAVPCRPVFAFNYFSASRVCHKPSC